jgi:hypothetical protein
MIPHIVAGIEKARLMPRQFQKTALHPSVWSSYSVALPSKPEQDVNQSPAFLQELPLPIFLFADQPIVCDGARWRNSRRNGRHGPL